MLNQSEKAYCQALKALKDKDYPAAAEFFDIASEKFGTDAEFNLLKESTRLLISLKQRIVRRDSEANDEFIIEEVFANGEEGTDLSR
ncbi:MAG: hypothetical protein V3T31_07975 [candidate division Zixibacteria bacterium]